jgi:hypothetical protein
MTTENQETAAPTAAEPAAQNESASPASADLNVSDLAALKSIIDVATQRGSFRAPELEAVGKTYNKLSNFLDSITKKEQ